MGNALGSISIANAFGIGLGCLAFITFCGGLIKLFVMKRRLKKQIKLDDLENESAPRNDDGEKLVNSQRTMTEGDLFGVRAIQAGYFGGVSQSRPSSPGTSIHRNTLPPHVSSIDDISPASQRVDSSVLSITSVPSATHQPYSNHASITSTLSSSEYVKRKPSPLRLQVPDASYFNGNANKAPTDLGVGLSSVARPLPSPISVRSFATTASTATSGWVSPLDVHFSRPVTPNSPRPTSYLPRLQFPDESGQSILLIPPPSLGSDAAAKSSAGSLFGESTSPVSIIEAEPPKLPEIPKIVSPTFSPFPLAKYTRGPSARSIFFMAGEEERPTRKSFKQIPIPPTPQNPEEYSPPQSVFEEDDDDENKGLKNVFENSDFAKRLSSYRRSRQTDSKIDHELNNERPSRILSRTRSRSSENTTQRHNQSPSRRSKSMVGLARVRNSMHIHTRKNSRESINKVENRRSRERDQIHYDPRTHNRNRSGSVQGRKVDFDHPRESPFSNANALIDHSRSNSESSIYSHLSKATEIQDFEFNLTEAKPEPLVNRGRQRSASDTSQNSIGDLYDSYYRRSLLIRQASQKKEDVGIALSAGLRRPPPVKVGSLFLGDTIIEVATPALTPTHANDGRFPTMI